MFTKYFVAQTMRTPGSEKRLLLVRRSNPRRRWDGFVMHLHHEAPATTNSMQQQRNSSSVAPAREAATPTSPHRRVTRADLTWRATEAFGYHQILCRPDITLVSPSCSFHCRFVSWPGTRRKKLVCVDSHEAIVSFRILYSSKHLAKTYLQKSNHATFS